MGNVTKVTSKAWVQSPSIANETTATVKLHSSIKIKGKEIDTVLLKYDANGWWYGKISNGVTLIFEFDDQGQFIDAWPVASGSPNANITNNQTP